MEERVAEAEWMMDGAVTTRRRRLTKEESSEGKRPSPAAPISEFFRNVLNGKKSSKNVTDEFI